MAGLPPATAGGCQVTMINRPRPRATQGTASWLRSPDFQLEAAARGAGVASHSSDSAQRGLIAVCGDG